MKGRAPTDAEYRAHRFANSFVSKVCLQIAMNDQASLQFGGQDEASPGVTVLSSATLRSPQAIATALNIQSDSEAPKMAEFLRGIAGMRTSDTFRNALTVGTDSAGGYTVPSVLMPDFLAALVPNSSLLSAGAKLAILSE